MFSKLQSSNFEPQVFSHLCVLYLIMIGYPHFFLNHYLVEHNQNYNNMMNVVWLATFETTCKGWHLQLCYKLPCVAGEICTVASHLSTHPFKYASQLNMHFMTKFLGINIFQWNISWIVIWPRFWFFLHLALRTIARTLAWNFSNDFLKSSNASSASVWTLEQSNWSSISRICL